MMETTAKGICVYSSRLRFSSTVVSVAVRGVGTNYLLDCNVQTSTAPCGRLINIIITIIIKNPRLGANAFSLPASKTG